MPVDFSLATLDDAADIGGLVYSLTEEICACTGAQHFDIDLDGTIRRCREFLTAGHYAAVVGRSAGATVAVATLAETYALYAGGRIGVVQEFYVVPGLRSGGVGAGLLAAVQRHGVGRGWSCMELCTPPLPEFERTLTFYRRHGLVPVGGRKMRKYLGEG
jgi:GNAT superfamily N-acetyltransferase